MRAVLAAALLFGFVSVAAAQAPPPADLANPPADATKAASGLISKVLEAGRSADKPGPVDVVSVDYTGWSSNGAVFASSSSRGGPSMFPVNRSMLGLRECILQMTIGEKRRCWVPESLGYRGAAGRPKGTLVFDVELVDTRPNPTVAPLDVKEPPADAHRTANGIAYKSLRPAPAGSTKKPTQFSKVTVHYSGWTTDGKLFDSSVARGMPATFELSGGVIRGWTEGVPLITEGERMRLWIPEDLAYKGEAGSPRGMLVFDIELIKVD